MHSFDAVIFDLDGVVTKTALLHAEAWKSMFDGYLRLRAEREGKEVNKFFREQDYLLYIDGKPRYKGVESFLESRGIKIPYGRTEDSSEEETVCGLGNKKNEVFNKILRTRGVEVYSSTIELILKLKREGVRIAVASSSKNCRQIIDAASITDLFETRVDGVVSAELHLSGKPEGDIFVVAARNLGTIPAKSIVVEDAISGVQAGRNGGFGMVVGVARKENEKELFSGGADIVVSDLAETGILDFEEWFHRKPVLLIESGAQQKSHIKKVEKRIENKKTEIINPCYAKTGESVFFSGKKPVFFLDYDGTLTPIVSRPELAVLKEDMRAILKRLSDEYTVTIVSGRMREDVENLVNIKGIFYAGSHGFDIKGPGFSMVHSGAEEGIGIISQVIGSLSKKLGGIPNVLIEEKKFSAAVHYRLVDESYFPKIKETVENLAAENKRLRLMSGKKVFEILPDIDWDKGKAIRWVMKALNISWDGSSVIYIGDDTTDEDAFRVVRVRGAGILVSGEDRESAADFRVPSEKEVKILFENVIEKR